MAICKISASHVANFYNVLGQYVKVILPFLASIILIFCSKSLYIFLIDGHHVDACTVLLRMMQCAAFVAPATCYLLQTIGYGPVLFIGACFTTLGIGITSPSLFAEIRKQEIAFVVLYGTGVSIMFQATSMAAASIFRANTICSVLLLGMSAAIIFSTQHLFQLATINFSVQTVLVSVLLIPFMCIFPAFIDVIHTRRSETSKSDGEDFVDTLLYRKTIEDCSTDEELLTNTMTTEKTSPCAAPELNIQNNSDSTVSLNTSDLKWRLGAILWWAIGIHLSFLSSSTRDITTDYRMLLLVCSLSLVTFGVKILMTRGKNNSDNAAGYFVLGILGINGLVLRFYPIFTDIHCYSLLFSMGFFHQLKPSNDCHKVYKAFGDLGWMINQICVELVVTFCAMAAGYQIANIIYYSIVAHMASSKLVSDISLTMISSVMVLLSLRYCTKKELTKQSAMVDPECNGQKS